MNMTKEQAKKALWDGHKVSHRHFSPEEWVKSESAINYIFEDGVKQPIENFWAMRKGIGWGDGWSIV